jgi:hypothetical protein
MTRFFICQTVTLRFDLGALSDERTSLQFVVQSVNGLSRGGLITTHYCLICDYFPFCRLLRLSANTVEVL